VGRQIERGEGVGVEEGVGVLGLGLLVLPWTMATWRPRARASQHLQCSVKMLCAVADSQEPLAMELIGSDSDTHQVQYLVG
jgi:hypothetical protein